jgi:hypothetical protein
MESSGDGRSKSTRPCRPQSLPAAPLCTSSGNEMFAPPARFKACTARWTTLPLKFGTWPDRCHQDSRTSRSGSQQPMHGDGNRTAGIIEKLCAPSGGEGIAGLWPLASQSDEPRGARCADPTRNAHRQRLFNGRVTKHGAARCSEDGCVEAAKTTRSAAGLSPRLHGVRISYSAEYEMRGSFVPNQARAC